MSDDSFKQYGTHIIITSSEIAPEIINGKCFSIRFLEIESYTFTHGSFVKRKVIIEAKSINRAQFVCDLIICSMCLDGFTDLAVRDIAVYPFEPNSNEKPLYHCNVTEFQTPGIPLYCKLAAKISFYRSYVNAINKYLLSCEIHSTHWIDLDPNNGPNIPLSPFPYDHLRYGYAIVIAYSIIEELSLGVNASTKKPSLIQGEWNPIVKEDLEKRLLKAKIDIKEPIVWERRGAIKNLEKRRNPKPLNKTTWAYGDVRDCEVFLIDAINNISWLRSKIAAHRVDKDIKSLSVYDVSNAQHLARRLLLESLGFWKMNEQ
jgi:hypothetical protein